MTALTSIASRVRAAALVALPLLWFGCAHAPVTPPATPAAPAVSPATPAAPATSTAAAPAAAPNTAVVPVPQRLEDGLPQSAVDNFTTRHDRYVARAQHGGVDVLFVGDSITQGWGSTGKAVWDESYGAMKAEAFGIGWDRTQHVLWRLQHGEGQGLAPKVIVLLIGTNNAGPNTNEEAAAGVTAVVQELRKDFRSAKILLLAVFPRGAPGTAPRDRVTAINQMIAKLHDGRQVFYLDIGKVFLDADGVIARDIMADLLHPTAKGYRLWADAMNAPLAQLVK